MWTVRWVVVVTQRRVCVGEVEMSSPLREQEILFVFSVVAILSDHLREEE